MIGCILKKEIKTRMLPLIGLYLLAMTHMSCSDQDKASSPYQAYVMYLDKSKSTIGTPHYSLGAQELTDLADISNLEGSYFSIREGGILEVEVNDSGVMVADKFEKGSTPNIRYKLSNGVVIPKDYNSLVMLSVFYQFQEIFTHLEEYTGVVPQDIVSQADRNKLSIWYEPMVTNRQENNSSSSVSKLNAAYLQGSKQFVLFQRSSLERVPIAANLSVLAHEFGHALFEYVFYGNQYDPDKDGVFEIDPLFGINEGFADYISYIYTGVSNILGSSFLFAEDYIQRDFIQTTFTYDTMRIKISTGGKDTESTLRNYCTGGYYCYGTLLARSFYEAAKVSGYEGEKGYEYLKKIFASLTKTREVLLPLTPQFYDTIENQTTGDEKEVNTPKVLSLFLYALLLNFDESLRDKLCSSLIKNFGSVMNKADHSGVCSNASFPVTRKYFNDIYE